ncbi:50S ribosomal protein L25/general stress protein Ctc [Bacillus shivajii]|uniref:50S ribosomal protein L25/general stress protein Ctc n=1 Tax=Bacillus shivajii TaxID=1983719 RepID=UPI001CFA7B1B|nr:50S ribosomal protein L25/general stress protein Ctc [Bacillus shivajii]UCZ53310.1 50S ribosomal protein L25/general stress protein Ctc [Bacillus shivajii]
MATVLQAAKREDRRGSRLNKIRNHGGVPGVIYGKAFGNEPVTVDQISFIKTLRQEGKTGVFKLELDGKKTDVMIYDLQYDTIKNEIIHVDFCAVDMKSKMSADVPVQVVGEAEGVKNGGVLQQAVYELSVEALPADLPESIEVDVTNLNFNDSIQVKDLQSGAKFEFNNDPEEVVLSVLPPTEQPEEPGVGGQSEGQEPELVGQAEGENDQE